MHSNIIKINDFFKEVDTIIIDEQKQLSLDNFLESNTIIRLFRNDQGEFLLQPVIKIPESELWLYKNKKAYEIVQKGLKEADEDKISKLDLDEL
ncbi:SpoVT-AbrB domain-containing protein [Candidatus Magnetomoraceae bacterium gMMP-15]